MSNNQTKLLQISIAKMLANLVPGRFRYRLVNLLYPFHLGTRNGIDLVTPYMTSTLNLRFLLNTREYIGWNIFFLNEYESETNALLMEMIKPGMTVVEAGANNGSETVIIAELVGPSGRVFAFEPIDHCAQLLDINVRLNCQQQQVHIERIALGSSTQIVDFYVSNETASNQGMSSKYRYAEAQKKVSVPQTTLDQFLKDREINRLDFIKMDIQGGELDMIQGSHEVMMRFRPIIYFEADEVQLKNGQSSLSALFEIINGYGYDLFHILPMARRPLSSDYLISGNWLALPRMLL